MSDNRTGTWTDERVGLLRKYWADGMSASQIAATMAEGLTRNAVLSKVHRLGIAERVSGYQRPTNRIYTKSSQSRAERCPPAPPREDGGPEGGPKLPSGTVEFINIDGEAFDLAIPPEQRRSIHAVKKHECHWPVGRPGTPEFFFCGAPIKPEKPYCPDHCTRAFDRPKWHQTKQLNYNPGGRRA